MSGVLVTGFEAWANHETNPSGILATQLGGVLLPTRYRDSERALVKAVRERRPDALLMLGLAENRKTISIEMVAVNADHAEIADNAGEKRQQKPIDPAGPLALATRLPVERLCGALKRARIPVSVSYHAGTFCCNHLFYFALRRLELPCGFIHVPPFRRVGRKMQERAIRILLNAL